MKPTIRTCIACRGRESKEQLLRFVVSGEELVLDREQRLPGRGAYLHRSSDCLLRKVEIKRWNHALKMGTLGSQNARFESLRRLLKEIDGAPR